MSTPTHTELARAARQAAQHKRSIVRSTVEPYSSAAARALQRLSARARWSKLTPAQRSAEMKRVRAAATTLPSDTVPPPASASASASSRSLPSPKSSGQ